MSCIQCGKNKKRFNFLCQDCYLQSHPIILNRNRIKITVCKNCLTPVGVSGNWDKQLPIDKKLDKLESTIGSVIQKKYKFSKGISSIKTKITQIDTIHDFFESLQDKHEIILEVKGLPDPFLPEIEFKESLIVYFKYKFCIHCQNIGEPSAILGKLQIRGIKLWQKEIDEILEEYVRRNTKDKKIDFLPVKIDKLKEGIDLSFSSKNPVEIIAHELNAKLATQNIKTDETISYDHVKSKSKLRLVISARLPSYKPGDVIKGPKTLIQIITINGTRSFGYNYFKGEFTEINNDIFWDNTYHLFLPLDKFKKFQIINMDKYNKTINLMDLDTYQEFEEKLIKDPKIFSDDTLEGFIYEQEENLHNYIYFNFFGSDT